MYVCVCLNPKIPPTLFLSCLFFLGFVFHFFSLFFLISWSCPGLFWFAFGDCLVFRFWFVFLSVLEAI